MKFKLNFKFLIPIISIIISFQLISTIGVGFLTLNLENGILNGDELEKIVTLLNYVGDNKSPIGIIQNYEDVPEKKLRDS